MPPLDHNRIEPTKSDNQEMPLRGFNAPGLGLFLLADVDSSRHIPFKRTTPSSSEQMVSSLSQVVCDAASVASGFLARSALARVLPGGTRYLTGARFILPFFAAGLAEDVLTAKQHQSSSNWLRGAGLYGASLFGLSAARSICQQPAILPPELMSYRLPPLRSTASLIEARGPQIREFLSSTTGDASVRLGAERELAILENRQSTLCSNWHPTEPIALTKNYSKSTDRAIDQYAGVEFTETLPERIAGYQEVAADYESPLVTRMCSVLSDRYSSRTGLNVLEIGPSIDTSVPLTLRKSMSSYIAIDAQEASLAVQRQALLNAGIGNSTHMRSDLCRLPLASASQDLLVASCNNVFASGQSVELELAFTEAARVLRTGGEFVLQPWTFVEAPATISLGSQVTRHPWRVRPAATDILLSRFKIVDWHPLRSDDYCLVLTKRI